MSGYRIDLVPGPYELQVEALDSESRRRDLADQIERATDGLDQLADQVRAEADQVAELEVLIEQRRHLFFELERLHLRTRDAQTNLRRAERALAREQARNVGEDAQGDRVRRGRMVKLQVDPGAWHTFKVDAKRRRRWLGWELGQLVVTEIGLAELGDASGLPGARRRRGPGEGELVLVPRSLRVFIDEDLWPQFAALATQHRITVGRYLGELVEAEAHSLGWRAELQ